MPLASTDPSFGSIRLQPFHLYARELRAVELADALRPQPADEIVAGGRFVDQTLDVNAQAGRAARRQQGEGGGRAARGLASPILRRARWAARGGAAAALTEAPRSWWACRTMSGRGWRACHGDYSGGRCCGRSGGGGPPPTGRGML